MIDSRPLYFPFGQELKRVQQSDRTPKKIFVLGVYASAVHARWVGADGREKIKAFAVASEPCIFWKGEKAEQIIATITIPNQLGKLTIPTDKKLNGPSGIALDELFLRPLGFEREDSWLCDLLPESRINPQQRKAINKHYNAEIFNKFNLTAATIPDFDEGELERQSATRQIEILEELVASKAETLILLGDIPIYWFLRFHHKRYSKLSQFGETRETYGKPHELRINDRSYNVVPLCHPRNAARLGTYGAKWASLHDMWKPEKI
jgi:uracil-DNA glycosylase